MKCFFSRARRISSAVEGPRFQRASITRFSRLLRFFFPPNIVALQTVAEASADVKRKVWDNSWETSGQVFENRERSQNSDSDSVAQISPDHAQEIQRIEDDDERHAQNGPRIQCFHFFACAFPEDLEILCRGESVHANREAEPIEKPRRRVGSLEHPNR